MIFDYYWISPDLTTVKLDGEKVGEIRRENGKFTYHAGSLGKHKGEPFDTLADCKDSLENF
jgi:hypothetical protein